MAARHGDAHAPLLEASGVPAGIDLTALLALREKVAGWLHGEQTHGSMWRAGLPKTFRAATTAAAA